MTPGFTMTNELTAACQQACDAITPSWPLDQSAAVNPHFMRTQRPVLQVAVRMAVLAGIRVYPSRTYFRQAWDSQQIVVEDLQAALQQHPGRTARYGLTAASAIQALNHEPDIESLPLLMDILDVDPQHLTRMSWRQAITHQISQTCAAYFDEHQAAWQPSRDQGLYRFWRQTLLADHGIATLMGLPPLESALSALPEQAPQARQWVMQRLGLKPEVWPDYLEAVLLTIQGWASWCAYLQWQARLRGESDTHLMELLSIRLAWGVILLECQGNERAQHAFAVMQARWQAAATQLQTAEQSLAIDDLWQNALDRAYQRQLHQQLVQQSHTANLQITPDIAAVFCMDTRSEPLRRALESALPSLRTLGFAGFFGVPLAYRPLGAAYSQPHLPGLLAPSILADAQVRPQGQGIDDQPGRQAALQHQTHQQSRLLPWEQATHWPSSAFTFVESLGVTYLPRLLHWLRPASQQPGNRFRLGRNHIEHPALVHLDPAARTALAARILTAMGLTQPPPLVVFVGHASQSANNAHASSLNCGACAGQSGLVNARALAYLLNDPELRSALREHNIKIPADTFFIGAEHNTTTDAIELADQDLVPASQQARCQQFLRACAQASDSVRRQRAPSLGLVLKQDPGQLQEQFVQRAHDVAMTRPEWGLVSNAALIIAPRYRSQGLTLNGRVFLHEYDPAQDSQGTQLEALMTAPMVVAHWINWQYHASTCDPIRLGSGNKLLHNVVGGRIGVFEGNGGDLRIGLSRQSLHDGQHWLHDPVRLTVVIDAPSQRIDQVLGRHPEIRQLVDHEWLSLWSCHAPQQLLRYVPPDTQDNLQAQWQPLT